MTWPTLSCQICKCTIELRPTRGKIPWHGRVCSRACWQEYEWRDLLHTRRLPYEIDPQRTEAAEKLLRKVQSRR